MDCPHVGWLGGKRGREDLIADHGAMRYIWEVYRVGVDIYLHGMVIDRPYKYQYSKLAAVYLDLTRIMASVDAASLFQV